MKKVLIRFTLKHVIEGDIVIPAISLSVQLQKTGLSEARVTLVDYDGTVEQAIADRLDGGEMFIERSIDGAAYVEFATVDIEGVEQNNAPDYRPLTLVGHREISFSSPQARTISDIYNYTEKLSGDKAIECAGYNTVWPGDTVSFAPNSLNARAVQITANRDGVRMEVSETSMSPSSVILSPQESGDNGYWADGSFFPGENELLLADNVADGSFICFRDIPIPNGATIKSAFLEMKSAITLGDYMLNHIYANDVDNATPPTTYNEAVNLVLTTANVDFISYTVWNQNSIHLSPDISPVIQEIVSRPGWQSGNNLQLVIEGDNYNPRYIYSNEGGFGPQLHITWEQ